MNIAPVETEITALVRAGQLNLAYALFRKLSLINRLRPYFPCRAFVRMSGWLISWYLNRTLQSDRPEPDLQDDAVDLNPSFVLFWKNPDSVGLELLVKITRHYYQTQTLPVRALAWLAHWLVFQGDYPTANRLFRKLLPTTRGQCRIHGECLSLFANLLYCRQKPQSADRIHHQSHQLLTKSEDRFFQMFNLGLWIRVPAAQGSREKLVEIIAKFDQLNPDRPDERYGLRLLITTAYVHEISGKSVLSDRFRMTAENVMRTSGSALDRSIYHGAQCLIYLQRSQKTEAIQASRLAQRELKNYGSYSYYSSFYQALENSARDLPQATTANKRSLSVADPDSEILLQLIEKFEKLPAHEFIQEVCEKLALDQIKTESIPLNHGLEPVFRILTKPYEAEFHLHWIYHDQAHRWIALAPFLPWRNPVDFNRSKALLLALQGHCFRAHAEKTKALVETAREVAHDIRSPIAALQVIQSLENNLSHESRELMGHVVERIRGVADRMLDVQRSLSLKNTFASGASQQQVIDLIEKVVQEKRLTTNHSIAVCQEINQPVSGLNEKYQLDPNSFCSLLSNIIDNAIEASSEKYHKPIRIIVRESTETKDLELEVQDSGHGIPQEILKTLGREHFRSTKPQGNGLGLLQARRALESWNGRLTIRSRVGRGTRVQVALQAIKG